MLERGVFGNPGKVLITSQNHQIVLDGDRSNPKIIVVNAERLKTEAAPFCGFFGTNLRKKNRLQPSINLACLAVKWKEAQTGAEVQYFLQVRGLKSGIAGHKHKFAENGRTDGKTLNRGLLQSEEKRVVAFDYLAAVIGVQKVQPILQLTYVSYILGQDTRRDRRPPRSL